MLVGNKHSISAVVLANRRIKKEKKKDTRLLEEAGTSRGDATSLVHLTPMDWKKGVSCV